MDISTDALPSVQGMPTCQEVIKGENNFLTEKILEEEKILERKIQVEEEEIENEMMKEGNLEKEQCFKRLQHLLSRSSIYAKYLAEKLEQQEENFVKKKIKDVHKSERATERYHDQNEPRSSKRIPLSVNDGQDINVSVLNKKRKNKDVKESHAENSRSKKHKSHNTLNIKDYFTKEDLDKKTIEGNGVAQDCVKACTEEEVSDLQPKLFSGGIMRPYQIDGYEWLKILYENGVNGILADEMGLGKTIQCIALISHLVEMNVPGPFFVCAPLCTLSNWVSEFNRFAPEIPVILFHGVKEERKSLARRIKKKVDVGGKLVHPVVITSYQVAIIERPKLANIEWKYLIIDEAHRIKNYQCRLFRELKQYYSLNRLLLTGTPLQNNLAELWALLNFILPEIFDDLKVFEAWFDIKELSKSEAAKEIAAQEQEKQIISCIHQILTPFLLRRTKADITLLLPPKKEVIVYAPLTSLQQKYYKAIIDRTIRSIAGNEKENSSENDIFFENSKRIRKNINYKGIEDKYFANDEFELEEVVLPKSLPISSKSYRNDINMKNTMMMCRKACSHPYLISHPLDPATGNYLIDDDFVSCCGKLLVLDAMFPELRSRGHKILIFSQFVMMLDLLAEFCELRNFKYLRYDGTMKICDRDNNIKQFNEDKSQFVFLISTRAGGLGINLASADTVIFYDSDWNPQSDLQAQDRCHRIGQTKPVVVYRLVTKNTIDQRMVERADAKRKLERMIIQKGRFCTNDTLTKSQTAITPEELLELLQISDVKDFVETRDNIFSPGELEALLDRSDMINTN